jgi:hypothetical protein
MKRAPFEAANALHSMGRRKFLGSSLVMGAGWMTGLASRLARAAEAGSRKERPYALVSIWLAGGPSQLETFDPHPGHRIAGDTKGIRTKLSDVELAQGLDRTAEVMDSLSLIRSMVIREADHPRAAYAMKTGFSPELSIMHPSLGSIVCHALPGEETDLPRHISILGGDPFIPHQPARGGMLGSHYDAFHVLDPAAPIPNLKSPVDAQVHRERLRDLEVVEDAFAIGRKAPVTETRGAEMTRQAVRMMSSAQLAAFDVHKEPIAVQRAYGDNPFGRGCLAARRLIENGVTAVEVTLDGWDSHINNHTVQRRLVDTLDPALASLIAELRDRDLLDRTVIVCAGEFGRTPIINVSAGRDHWNHGFSVALTGGKIRRGTVIGATDPAGKPLDDGYSFADLSATLLAALGIGPAEDNYSRDGRPVRRSLGHPISELLTR